LTEPNFQDGVNVPIPIGCSVQEFLCDQLGIDPEFVAQRITTVFFNGKVVDDLSAAILTDQSTLALSAAMPGLVGATLRRGGYYAAMRKSVSLSSDHPGATSAPSEAPSAAVETGVVRVKLFNLLIAELGPLILSYLNKK
jgi:hypothetical protein